MSKLRAMIGFMIKKGYSPEDIQSVVDKYKEKNPEAQVVQQPVPEYSSDEFASDSISNIEKEEKEKAPPTINVPPRPGFTPPAPQREDTPEGYLDEIADETREISSQETKDVDNMYSSALSYYDDTKKALGLPEDMSDKEVKEYLKNLNEKSDYYDSLDSDGELLFAGQVAKDYQAHEAELKRLKGVGGYRGIGEIKEPKDVSQLNTLKSTYLQNEAVQKYWEQNPTEKIAFDSIVADEDETVEKKQALFLEKTVYNSDEFKQIQEQVKSGVNGDEEKLKKQSDFVLEQFKQDKKQSKFEDRISEKLYKDKGGVAFYESEEERKLTGVANKRRDKKIKENEDLLQKFEIVNEDLTSIDKELKELVKYFDNTDIEKEIENAQNKEYSSNEEIKKAQEELDKKIFEYRKNGARYNFLSDEGKKYIKLSNKLFQKLEKGSLEENELRIIAGEIGRNRGVVTTWFANLGNAAIDLVQGLGDSLDMVFQAPEEVIKLIDDPALEGYMQSALRSSSPLGWVFADEEKTRNIAGKSITTTSSHWTRFGDKLDKWQELNITNKVRRPVEFGKIGGFGDAVEWSANLFASQIPNLVLMAATGGASLYVMGASAAGNKYRQLQDEKDLYMRTGGLYGQNLSYGTMVANASFSGTMEALSERVTLGAVGKTAQSLTKKAGKDAAKLGYESYLRKNIFTFNNIKSTGGEFFEEGFSESLASMGSNLADILSGNKDVNIYDGVGESFISGGVISSGLQGLRLAPKLVAPFQGEDNNQRVGKIANRISEVSKSLASMMGQEGAGVTVRRARLEEEHANLVNEANELIEQDIKRVNLLSKAEKKQLINIEKANFQARQSAENIMADENLTPEQKTEEIDALRSKVDKNNKKKQKVLDKYPSNVVDDNYKQEMEAMKAYEKEVAEQGGVPFVTREVDSNQMGENISQDEYDASIAGVENIGSYNLGLKQAASEIINDPNSTPEEIAEAKEALKMAESQVGDVGNALDFISRESQNYGGMRPVFNKDGGLERIEMLVNKETALTDGMFNTASHEFVHGTFYNTLKQDPAARKKLGGAVIDILNDKSVFMSEKDIDLFNKRVGGYKATKQGEEAMAIAMEMYRAGQIKFNDSFFVKMKGVFRRFAQNYLGHDISLDTAEDIKNFMRDYDVSVRKNKPNKAIARMIANGAKGKMFEGAKAPTDAETSFSKNVDQVLKEDPLVKKDFDQYVQNDDGSKKYNTKQEFLDSIDSWEAMNFIENTPRLDGLIAAGINLEAGPMRDYVRKVKEKLGNRLRANFNPAINESLFGWLTGVSGGAGKSIIFRAKGDVLAEMNQATPDEGITSIDKVYGDYGDLSETLQSESDAYMERLENMDLSPGARQAIQEIITGLVVDNVLEISQDGKAKIKDIVTNYKGSFDGLFYKDFKKLVGEVAKVEKDGVIKRPTKEGDVTPLGPLYGILEVISGEFGIEPARILANQDLDDTMRVRAQELILSKSLNQDGTFNPAMFDLLPEGEDRTGKATGIARGALGKFYDKGSRIDMGGKDQSGSGVGKARQDKIDSVDQNDWLDTFGINPDGTFRPGTSSDGAIRQLALNLSALSALQNIKLEGLQNGLLSEKLAAKISDGKSEMSYSKKVKQDPIDFILDEVLANYGSPEGITIEKANSIIQNAYGLKTLTKQAEKEAKALKADVEMFMEIKASEAIDINIEQFIVARLDQAAVELSLKKALGIKGSISDVYTVKDEDGNYSGVSRLRKVAQDTPGELVESGISQVDAGRTVMQDSFKLSFSGMGKIGDGRSVPLKDGDLNVVDNPTNNDDGTPALVKNKKGKMVKPGNRSKAVMTVSDHLALMNNTDNPKIIKNPETKTWIKQEGNTVKVWDGKSEWVAVETTQLKETTGAVVKDRDGTKREEQSQEARVLAKTILDNAWKKVQKGEMSMKEFGALMTTLGAGMDSALRKSAPVRGIVKNVSKIIAWANKNGIEIKDALRFEHSVSKAEINKRIVESYQKNGELDIESVFDGYEVNVIPAAWDDAMTAAGLQTKSPTDGGRMFDPVTLMNLAKDPDVDPVMLQPIESISPKENNIEETSSTAIEIVKHFKETKGHVREQGFGSLPRLIKSKNSMMKSKKVPSRGMSAFDFDETLIVKGENFVIATDPQTGNEVKISSEQWPIKGPQLMKDGYEFNFNDFVNVRGGVEGPLMQKLRNRIKKFGPENTFVLTARPQASAIAIHEWLKSKNINIPIENITGLGDSTGAAKGAWIANKYGEGYNDVYFVDDALPNVDAVKDVMDQLDIKGKSVQVRNGNMEFSRKDEDLDAEFNKIIEDTTGVQKEKVFSKAKGRQRGKGKGRWKFFLPPSAEDLKGLLYPFLGKGKKGEAAMKFFNDTIIVPYAKAVRALNAIKQSVSIDLKALKKSNKKITKALKEKIDGIDFTLEQALMIYNYAKAGIELPGLSQSDKNAIVKFVEGDSAVKLYADQYGKISETAGGLQTPSDIGWLAETLSSNLNEITNKTRDVLLQEFQDNWNTIFSEKNLNKIESQYGLNHRIALEDMFYRMKHGTNKRGGDSNMNKFMNWVHGSIGTTMFFNARSALLQTLSTVNFINWSDNNPLKAGMAFANQKQFWSDFLMLFDSPFLKQRRAGLSHDVNANELVEAVKGSRNPVKTAIGILLQKGFLPTQMADSFAIAFGGATFIRNRINKYVKQGMSKQEAMEKAFIEFQEIAEETQQSARPDKISQLQASPLGKIIFAFQNTPMQYNRLMKRAAQDLINGRGDTKTHISKILYYGAIQNAIFYSLQQALFAVTFGDDEEEDEKKKQKDEERYGRIANGMADTILRGSGLYGAVFATIKNTVLEFFEQEKKKHRADHAYTVIEALNLAVPIGIKARKMYGGLQSWEFNRDVIKHMPMTSIDNPVYDAAFAVIEATTNVPLSRIHGKIRNVREAMNSDHRTLERIAMVMGWSSWSFDIQPQALLDAKKEVKIIKKEISKEKAKQKRIEKEKIREQENKQVEKENIKKKDGLCAGISRSGTRCKNKALEGGYCTVHQKVEKRKDDKKVQCTKIKSDGKRCKMTTNNKSSLCYYHD